MLTNHSGSKIQHETQWDHSPKGVSIPQFTTTTCRCGFTHRQPGFLSAETLLTNGWELDRKTGEVFCSTACYREYAPEAVADERRDLLTSKSRLDKRLAALAGEV